MLKTVTNEIIKFIPSAERTEAKPTTVCFKALSKGQYDSFLNSLTEFKRNKLTSKTDRASEILFRLCLAPDEDGVIVYNAFMDNKEVPKIEDKELAIKYLLGLSDIESANEIEQAMRGQIVLEDAEEKN